MDDNAAVVITLREHLAVGRQKGLEPAILDPHLDIDVHKIPAERFADGPGQLPAAGAGVERRKELVLGQHVAAGEYVQERALASVGIADERHGHSIAATGDLALLAALDALQFAAQIVDPLLDQPTIDFQLL